MSSTHPHLSETWRLALVGGIGSIPLTLFLYRLSGTGSELSLNMVFVGGLVAGYLAKRGSANAGRVGVRAGVIGAVPGLWLLFDTAVAVVGIPNPPVLEAVGVALMVGVGVGVLGLGGLAGLIGATVGAWLATKHLERRLPLTGQ